MAFEDVEQEFLLGIDDDADAAALEAGHNLLVDVVRQCSGWSRRARGCRLAELVELLEEPLRAWPR